MRILLHNLFTHPYAVYVVLVLFLTLLIVIIYGLIRFQRELRDFFIGMVRKENPIYDSTKFLVIVGCIMMFLTASILVIKCAIENTGLPGGSTELIVGIVAFLMAGTTGRAYVATKEKPSITTVNTSTESITEKK